MAMYSRAIPVHTSNGRNVSLTSFCPVPVQLEDADDADEAGVLDHPDEVVAGGRDGDAYGLRQDDRDERARPAPMPSERPRAGRVAPRSGLCERPLAMNAVWNTVSEITRP